MALTPYIPPATLSQLPRGNQFLQSETFNAGSWNKNNITVGANAGNDIYGFTTADRITRTTSAGAYIDQIITKAAANQTWTLSVYAQLGTVGNFMSMRIDDGAGNQGNACFNLSTGTISLSASILGAYTNCSATISPTNVAGIWRCTLTATTNTATNLVGYFSPSTVSQQIDAAGSGSTANCIVWGAQLEPYSNASAYAATILTADPGIWAGTQSLPVLPFLPGQSPAISKAPKLNTIRLQTASGRVRKTALWQFPLWQFELSYNVVVNAPTVPTSEQMILWEFFVAALGQYGSWLFVDPSDCYVPPNSPDIFGTGDGSTKVFQIYRTLSSGISEPVYDVYQPIILDNGVPTASALTFSPNGVVTFTTAPASGHVLSWFGYFFFGCEFLQDDLTLDRIFGTLSSGKSLKFTSLRA